MVRVKIKKSGELMRQVLSLNCRERAKSVSDQTALSKQGPKIPEIPTLALPKNSTTCFFYVKK